MVVLGLLRHRERPRHGDLDAALGHGAQELHVADLDRPRAPDRPDDARHRVLVAGPIEGDAGLVEVDALERGREAVRVALAAHLAVGDDVDTGSLHVLHRQPRRVVLRLLEVLLGHAPELARAHARRQPGAEALAVDQPVGLRIAPDDRRDEGSHRRTSLRTRSPSGNGEDVRGQTGLELRLEVRRGRGAAVPLQNRVTPLGELIAHPARGLVYGNRGCLHDEHGRIRRRYAVRRWIACRLEFKGWHRQPLLQPGRFTELFFLDEATAFAAGHRPCALCRREDYVRFGAIWRELHGGPAGADAMDARSTPSGSTPRPGSAGSMTRGSATCPTAPSCSTTAQPGSFGPAGS